MPDPSSPWCPTFCRLTFGVPLGIIEASEQASDRYEDLGQRLWSSFFFWPRSPAPESQFAAHRRSEEHTSELQSRRDLVCRLLLEKKKTTTKQTTPHDPQ